MFLTPQQQLAVEAVKRDGLPNSLLLEGYDIQRLLMTAFLIREATGVLSADTLTVEGNTTVMPPALHTLLQYSPMGEYRVVTIIVAKGDINLSVLSSLLGRTGEDLRVIIVAPHGGVPGFVRAQIDQCLEFSRLSRSEAVSVLKEDGTRNPTLVDKLADFSDGSVDVREYAEANKLRPAVLGAIRALRSSDRDALSELAPIWEEGHVALLVDWCVESITARPRKFSSDELDADKSFPFRVLERLYERPRPKFVFTGEMLDLMGE